VTPKVLALIWISATAALALAGLVTIALAWRGQPSRGRRRCGRCWYDMAAVVGLKCPECGTIARSEAGLFRPKRFRRALGVGVLLLFTASYVGLATSRMGPRGERWTRWIPTTVLVFIAPVDRAERGHELAQAVWLRSRSMWGWQEAIVARREIEVVGEVEIREWVQIRSVWPAGQPIPIRLGGWRRDLSIAGPRQIDVRSVDGKGIRLRVTTDSLHPFSWHGEYREPDWNHDEATTPTREIVLPAMEVGRHEFLTDLTLSCRGANRTVQHTIIIDVVPLGQQVMTPVTTPALDRTVADAMRARLGDANHPMIRVGLDSQLLFDTLYRASHAASTNWVPDPDVAVVIEVLDGDQVLVTRTLEQWGNEQVGALSLDELMRVAIDHETCDWKWDVVHRLRVRVRGDLLTAIRTNGSTRYWAGEVELPLREVLDQTPKEW
jgi:hypothetical protein